MSYKCPNCGVIDKYMWTGDEDDECECDVCGHSFYATQCEIIDTWKMWERIWDKSKALAISYHNWKDENKRGSMKQFSKRKEELYKEVEKIIRELK